MFRGSQNIKYNKKLSYFIGNFVGESVEFKKEKEK